MGRVMTVLQSSVWGHLGNQNNCARHLQSDQVWSKSNPPCGPLSGLFWIHWLVFWQVNLWEKWSSCLRGYSFQLGVQHPFLIGFVLAMYFWPSLGGPSTDFWSYLFLDLWGKELLPGVSMSALCTLNMSSGGTLTSSCSGEKFQHEVYQTVHQLIPHCQFHPGLLWVIRSLKPKPSSFIRAFLSFYHMRGSFV